MHVPDGDPTRQLSAFPMQVVPDGQELFAMVWYGSPTATNTLGQLVDGAAQNAAPGNNRKIINNCFMLMPFNQINPKTTLT